MTKTIYINWDTQDVLSTAAHIEAAKRRIRDAEEQNYTFGDWLDENYSSSTVFDWDEEQKKYAREDYNEDLDRHVEEEFNYWFKETEVDV